MVLFYERHSDIRVANNHAYKYECGSGMAALVPWHTLHRVAFLRVRILVLFIYRYITCSCCVCWSHYILSLFLSSTNENPQRKKRQQQTNRTTTYEPNNICTNCLHKSRCNTCVYAIQTGTI